MGISYPHMKPDKKTIVHTACRRLLRPLASMLLRFGMTWKEFSELSKSVFVQAATEEFGINGRPTNVSRVSILTGIARKEIKRQRDLLDANEPTAKRKTTDATRLLSGWHQDAEFVDASSHPKLLPETGQGPTFEKLFARYGGDIAMPTMIKELITTGAIERAESGEFRVLMRYYQPSVADSENLQFAVDRIHDVIETMNNNVFAHESNAPRFGGFAANDAIPVDAIPAFRNYLDKRGQEFLEEIDDWLTQHQENGGKPSDDTARVGISLFATEEKFPQENPR